MKETKKMTSSSKINRLFVLPIALLAVSTAMLLTSTASAQDEDPLTGSWVGPLRSRPMICQLAFHVQRTDDGYTATFENISRGITGIAISELRFAEGKFTAVLPSGATYTAQLKPADDTGFARLEGTWKKGKEKLPLVLQSRPQTPAPPFPYRAEAVTFGHDPDQSLEESFVAGPAPDLTPTHVVLAGTLTLPVGDGPHPAVALVSGGGPTDRDATFMGHKWFGVLADHLTRAGIAVLRYDDRGICASGGNFRASTSPDFAVDAAAALRFLATREEIDATRLGLIGHSEGGLIAPLVATNAEEGHRVAFTVLLAPPAVNSLVGFLHQVRLIAKVSGELNEAVEFSHTLLERVLREVGRHADSKARTAAVRAVVQASHDELPEWQRNQIPLKTLLARFQKYDTPWWRWSVGYEPTESLRAMRCDVLALFGGKDLKVDIAQHRQPLEEALALSQSKRVKVETLDGLNHLFQHAETGLPTEMAVIEETFAPEALKQISNWLRKTTDLDN